MASDNYIFKTGKTAEARLELVEAVYGPTSRMMLRQVGLKTGWRVADIGCGVGHVSRYLARKVGLSGHVVAVDISSDQLEVAQSRSKMEGFDNIEYVEAPAHATGLCDGQYDLVYSRLLLSHLRDPRMALTEFRRLLKKGGALICEDLVATLVYSIPETAVYKKLIELASLLSAKLGVDYSIGNSLPQMVRETGFDVIEVRRIQPAYFSGEEKRWWEYSFREAVPMFHETGFMSEGEIREMTKALEEVSLDKTTMIAQPVVTQVNAVCRDAPANC